MGGKSTLLRSCCLTIILAQMGSYVPCSSLSLSIFDRIFSRIGAQDKLHERKSTYFIELVY
jgi:DNA mismatch repair ATPase MutS